MKTAGLNDACGHVRAAQALLGLARVVVRELYETGACRPHDADIQKISNLDTALGLIYDRLDSGLDILSELETPVRRR